MWLYFHRHHGRFGMDDRNSKRRHCRKRSCPCSKTERIVHEEMNCFVWTGSGCRRGKVDHFSRLQHRRSNGRRLWNATIYVLEFRSCGTAKLFIRVLYLWRLCLRNDQRLSNWNRRSDRRQRHRKHVFWRYDHLERRSYECTGESGSWRNSLRRPKICFC